MDVVDSLSDLPALLQALIRPSALVEVAVLVACLGVAWAVVARMRPRGEAGEAGIWFGQRGFDGVLFPLLALLLAGLARVALRSYMPVAVLQLAVPILVSLALIRVSVRVLHAAFPASALVRSLERTLSWGVWIVTVLWITGLLSLLLVEAEALHWKIGDAYVSLRSLIEGGLSAVAVMLLMLWLSSAVESRLMRTSQVHLSVRKMAANATRAVLLLMGVLIAMSAAGIPLGALSVMGGAVGVGIGLGLQKLAANYVSGFVILAEQSLRIGDMVKVDNFEGRISDITARYTLIRALSGREAIVPNEMMITQRVENLTYADSQLVLSTVVQVAYGTDVEALMPRLVAAVTQVPRVLAEPSPGARLSAFADSGLELTVVFWIGDPVNGQVNAVGDVNLAILRLFSTEGVEIPFPQRVVHGLVAAAAPAAVDPLAARNSAAVPPLLQPSLPPSLSSPVSASLPPPTAASAAADGA